MECNNNHRTVSRHTNNISLFRAKHCRQGNTVVNFPTFDTDWRTVLAMLASHTMLQNVLNIKLSFRYGTYLALCSYLLCFPYTKPKCTVFHIYTKSRCLINIRTPFDACRRQLQRVPSQLPTFQHTINIVFTHVIRFPKLMVVASAICQSCINTYNLKHVILKHF